MGKFGVKLLPNIKDIMTSVYWRELVNFCKNSNLDYKKLCACDVHYCNERAVVYIKPGTKVSLVVPTENYSAILMQEDVVLIVVLPVKDTEDVVFYSNDNTRKYLKVEEDSDESIEAMLLEHDLEGAAYFTGDNYKSAIIGYTEDGRIVYSYDLMISWRIQQTGETYEEAVEWIEFNTLRTIPYMGQKAPIIMYNFLAE